ncbi:MAG TPA: alanine racemase [Acidimicrobiales bacterium]|nr:alanine racemase [Acidimicrobiales bacterium]
MARAWAEVDLGAVAYNVAALRRLVAPASLCAVVKANGYGHGAAPVGRAALGAGADWLAVAQVNEAVGLRDAGIEAPVLVLAEPRPDEVDDAVDARARLTLYSPRVVEAVARSVRRRRRPPVAVHVKVDTGMHRVGCTPDDLVEVAGSVAKRAELRLEGVLTHLPVADEPDDPYTAGQLARFDALVARVRAAGIDPGIVHAANSAGAIVHPASRYDMVRCGIAVYGIPPAPALAGRIDLRPAMTLASEVSFVKRVPAGDAISYGHRHRFATDTVVATVPIGYADGVFRSLPLLGQEVLVRGERRPMVGVVTMDQLMVDCGPNAGVAPGDPVVLLGRQGDERVTPDEWAGRLGTIAYEVVCAIGPRVARRYRA